MGKFQEHGVMLFLDRELYLAFIKLQADKKLGRSYTGLLPFTEGLYHMGYISKEVYEQHKQKYSIPLVQDKPKSSTLEQAKRQKKLKRIEKNFSEVLKQWNTMNTKSKQFYIKKAEKYKTAIPNAKLILALTNREIYGECVEEDS